MRDHDRRPHKRFGESGLQPAVILPMTKGRVFGCQALPGRAFTAENDDIGLGEILRHGCG